MERHHRAQQAVIEFASALQKSPPATFSLLSGNLIGCILKG